MSCSESQRLRTPAASTYNYLMRSLRLAVILLLLPLAACQGQAAATIAIIDGTQLHVLVTNNRVPQAMIAQAGVLLGPADELLFNGLPVARDAPVPAVDRGTLQVRRAVNISINGSDHLTTAVTVAEAIASIGQTLYAVDAISPSAGTFVDGPIQVQYTPSRALVIRSSGGEAEIRSAAGTIGAALAAGGVPLLGLDFSKPAENDALPADGNVRVVRVSEAITLAEKLIPFQSQSRQSADVELGQQEILQPGVKGLAVSRVRIRYEDGQEVSRQTEAETVVRPPQDRITAEGTKIVLKTVTVNGVTIQYWRQMQMYATVYSPCTSGGANGCSSGTASGLPAGKGVVAVDPGLYAYLNGQRLYIPGYGRAVIGDIGGGYLVEKATGVSRYRWIDLGFDDNNIVDMTGWVTVYFLAPAPASIPDILK